MSFRSKIECGRTRASKATILLCLGVAFFFAFAAHDAYGQRRFSRTYPAGPKIRLQLLNRNGTVTVEGWNRPEVAITATLEAPAATISPQLIDGTIHINLMKDNQGREVGNVNFNVRVPHACIVDIETLMGNLIVTNVRGGFVRAHISSEGDVTLTNISAYSVQAQNGIGDMFFDGEILPGGNYRFASLKGTISIRIPFTSGFKLVATAPSTRYISLGSFASESMNYLGDGRRVVGKFGDGSSTLVVTNQRGGISFLRR